MKEKNSIYLIAGIAVLVLIVSLVNSFLITKKIGQPVKPEFTEEKEGVGPTYSLGEFTVNLADPGRYLKVNIILELGNKSEELKEEVTKTRDFQIRDIVVGILSSERMEPLTTVEGKQELKRKIQDRISKILTKGKIKNVYFTDFVMQ